LLLCPNHLQMGSPNQTQWPSLYPACSIIHFHHHHHHNHLHVHSLGLTLVPWRSNLFPKTLEL
jgi:hypothetical protein